MQILVVDDALIIRKIITKILIEAGHESITAANGTEALQILNELEGIEIILSDWNMPGMNGFELLTEIRKNEKFKDIPFYLVTVNANIDNFEEADLAGISGYITKPFTAEDILSVLG